ncbi:MAG: pilin [Patescibacteria group bacterium]
MDRLSWFFIERAHAASTPNFFAIFDPFSIPGPGNNSKGTFANVVTYAMSWVLAIVALIAFVYLIISGVNYITAGGDAEKATKARSGILNAIIGIVVVVLAFFILRFAANLGENVVTRPS